MPIHLVRVSKASQIGTNFWMLRDATFFYILPAITYVGKEDRKGGLGKHVVVSLIKAYKNCGLNVTTHYVLKSLALARNLLGKNTTILGTARSYRRKISSVDQLGENMPLYYTSKFVFSPPPKNIMLLSCIARKNIVKYLLSSLQNTFKVDDDAKTKPKAILDNNAINGTINTTDKVEKVQMRTCHSIKKQNAEHASQTKQR